MVRSITLVMMLAGCNQLLGLHEIVPAPDADTTAASCAPLVFDQGRYISVSDANGLTWQQARDACRRLGFDLAVLDMNDGIEIGNEANGAQIPFWLGVSYGSDWQAVDDCPSFLDWAPAEPSHPAPGYCVVKNTLGMRSELCTSSGMPTLYGALCETPRPSPRCLAEQTERIYLLIAGTMTQGDAAAACGLKGMHLVEIDSLDELTYVKSMVAQATPKFWLGAAKNSGTYSSPTGCPQIFTWGPSDPDNVASNRCVQYNNGAMETNDCGDTANAVVCEKNSL